MNTYELQKTLFSLKKKTKLALKFKFKNNKRKITRSQKVLEVKVYPVIKTKYHNI